MNEIENMLEQAWNMFCSYYNDMAPRYRNSWPEELKGEKAKDSHWICWDEHDLVFHVGRFFYDILREKNKSEFPNIEVHFEKKVDRNNFAEYVFERRLDDLRNQLGMTEGPKIDMIVVQENSNDSLLLCAEAKCFRYYTNWRKAIDDDIKRLIALTDCNIAKSVVFMLFDDCYYYRRGGRASNAIQQRLDEIRNEYGITVLFHTSKAKLEN